MKRFNVTQTYRYDDVEAETADEAHDKVNKNPGQWFTDMDTDVEEVEDDA